MSRRKRYFMKQKLIGLMMIIMGIVGAIITRGIDGSGAVLLIFGGLGLCMVFTKDMMWMDDYFYEVEERGLKLMDYR